MSYAKTDRMDEAVQTFRRSEDFPSRVPDKHKRYFKLLSIPRFSPPRLASYKDAKFTFYVEFLSSGKIGTFVALDKMPKDYAEAAAKVLTNIKFKPEMKLEFPMTTINRVTIEIEHDSFGPR